MELIRIGKVLKTHGFKGHLKVRIEGFYMDDFEEMKAVFIDGLPHFIAAKDINSDEQAIIRLEDIDTKEKAQLLQGKPLFAREEDLSEIMEDDPYLELIGYSVEDERFGSLGTIQAILELPQQYLARIQSPVKEILMPINDAFVQRTDEKTKTVHTTLPDGFLDI